MTARRAPRWNVAIVAALLTSGTGVLLAEPTLLLLSVPAIVFAVYSHGTVTPSPTLDVERSIAEGDPSHDQEVEVTVTLRNTGERALPNVAIVDGVPSMLSVESGSARHAAALGPGDETSFSYTVVAKHGYHRFEPATVVLRDTSGSAVVETTVTTDTELACRSPIRTLPLGRAEHHYPGSAVATEGERGTEFSNVRSYRRGDPPNRIDWNRYARDGELTTVSFRENRSRSTVLCLDARDSCYRSSGSGEPHAVFYERTAARELLAAAASDEPIGLAVIGTEANWIAPETGSRHVASVRRTVEDPETVPLEPPNRRDAGGADSVPARTLRTRIERSAAVIVLSPLLDDSPLETARVLQADGHPVTVLSPDVTTTGSRGAELARLRRENRIGVLRRANVSVVDWAPETPLETAIRDEVRQ